jgi:hypothetical protein
MLLGPSELPSLTGQKLHGSAIRTDYGLRSRLGRLVRTKGMNSLKFVSNRSRPNNLKRRNEQGGSGGKVLSASSATLKLQSVNLKDPCALTSPLSALLSSALLLDILKSLLCSSATLWPHYARQPNSSRTKGAQGLSSASLHDDS